MDFQFVLYNGCALGLERKKNAPTWVNFGEGFGLNFFSGLCISFLCIRINIGTFLDDEEFLEEMEGP